MPVSSSVIPWQLTMPAGSQQQWNVDLTYLNAAGFDVPYPISGATWEYVVRTSPTDLSTPVIDLTTSANSQGVLVVTATASLSQVLIDIYAAATASLNGTYYHSLWMQPGNSASAFSWLTGQLQVEGNPQP